MIFGGLQVKTVRGTSAWGVTPSSSSVTGVASAGISVGAAVSMNFYGLFTVNGIVTRVNHRTDFSSGVEQDIEIVDNRIRLQWMYVFGAWNMEDETCNKNLIQPTANNSTLNNNSSSGGSDSLNFDSEDSPSGPANVVFPGGHVINPERRRRYWSILPENWNTRTRTYHNKPFSVRQILNSAFNYTTGHTFGFTKSYGSRSDNVFPLGVDYMNGAPISGLISAMNEKTGMDCYLTGTRRLVWDVKGSGSAPIPGNNSDSASSGTSLSTDPTRVRIMGDPMIVQVMNVELEPTWNRKYEKFIGEAAWLREVASRWGINEKTHWAEVAARAREITLSDYCAKLDKSWADYGYFGQVSRMSMKVWSYIEELVFKHYAVPTEHKLFGVIPQDSVSISDSLLCNVQMEGDGLAENAKMKYQTSPLEYYPGSKAFVMVKGQPLDALDTRDIAAFHALRIADTRKTWRVETDYEIDSCGIGIRFRVPVFIDGDASAGKSIFFYPNKGEKGFTDISSYSVPAASDLYKIVKPNPDFQVTPAEVKASFAFSLAPFWNEYGSGPRFGVVNANGLTAHILHISSGSFSAPGTASFDGDFLRLPQGGASGSLREILYADGDTAAKKAEAAWRSRQGNPRTIIDGSFRRIGAVGTQIGGAVDRVSFSIGFSDGVTESVDIFKQRIDRAFIAEKTLNRLRRMPELYAGQEALKQEVRNLRRIVEADRYKPQQTSRRSTSHKTLSDVQRIPVGGGIAVQTRVVNMSDNRAKSGDVLWEKDGVISKDGTKFAGIALHAIKAGDSKGNINVAYAGQIPVSLKGKFKPGDMAYASPGQSSCSSKLRYDSVPIGTYCHSTEIKDDAATFVGLVHIGFGGKGFQQTLQLYDFKPGKNGKPSTVKISPGFIVNFDPESTEEVVTYHPIDTLEDNPAPEFTVNAGDTIGIKVTTTPKDKVEEAVIEIRSEQGEQSQAIPDPVNEQGSYFYKIAKFGTAPDGDESDLLGIEKLYHCGGSIQHSFKINEVFNKPATDYLEVVKYEALELYHKWKVEESRHEFRQLFQKKDVGNPLLVKKAGSGGDDFDIAVVSLAEKGDYPQVKVQKKEDDDMVLEISGNGAEGSLVWRNCDGFSEITLLEWKDGLITTEGEKTFTAGCQWTQTPP